MVKDIAREHGATDHEITRAYLRVSGGFRPNPLVYKDLDAYADAWRDAIVKELRAYVAARILSAKQSYHWLLLSSPSARLRVELYIATAQSSCD